MFVNEMHLVKHTCDVPEMPPAWIICSCLHNLDRLRNKQVVLGAWTSLGSPNEGKGGGAQVVDGQPRRRKTQIHAMLSAQSIAPFFVASPVRHCSRDNFKSDI